MKTISKILSVAVIASASLFAGGAFIPAETQPDVEPVEPAVAEIPETTPAKDLQPYFGGALGKSTAKVNSEAKVCGGCQYDKLHQTVSKAPDKILKWGGSGDSGTLMALAGVELNDFLAVEARLTKAISDYEIKDHMPISYTNVGLYLKPQYKFELGSIYGLFGYGYSRFSFMDNTTSAAGFQYGAGGTYNINDELAAFVDYTKLYGGGKKISEATKMDSIDSINAGIIYKP